MNESEPVVGIPDLNVAKGLQADFPNIEHTDALRFVCELYDRKNRQLAQILAQRTIDRAFIDAATLQCKEQNINIDFQSPEYHTIIGKSDGR